MRCESKLTAVKRAGPRTASAAFAALAHRAAREYKAASAVRRSCSCMSSTRKLARLAAPVVCAAYVTYVAIDSGYYHIERRKELDAATARAKAEAASESSGRRAAMTPIKLLTIVALTTAKNQNRDRAFPRGAASARDANRRVVECNRART